MHRPPPVQACQRCGSADLRVPSVGDGVIVGLGQDFSRLACGRCGLVAVPLEFDSEASRRAFEAERAKDPATDWPAVGWPSLKPFDKG